MGGLGEVLTLFEHVEEESVIEICRALCLILPRILSQLYRLLYCGQVGTGACHHDEDADLV